MSAPVQGKAYTFKMGLVSSAGGGFVTNPTIAAGDFKISIGGAALTNLTNTPTVEPAGSKIVKIELTAAEMADADPVIVASDAAGAEWQDVIIQIDTRELSLEQFVKNKLSYDKGTDVMTLYDNDGTTPKFEHAMTDDASVAERGAAS